MDLKRNNPVSIVVMAVLFWLKNILLWLDQGLNVLLMGDPDETVSRRAGRARLKGKTWGCLLCKVLDWIDPRHCETSVLGDDEHEGMNSVAKMVGRWRRGMAPTWTPNIIILEGNQTIDLADVAGAQKAAEGIGNLGEQYSYDDLQKIASVPDTETPPQVTVVRYDPHTGARQEIIKNRKD